MGEFRVTLSNKSQQRFSEVTEYRISFACQLPILLFRNIDFFFNCLKTIFTFTSIHLCFYHGQFAV